MTKEEKRKFIKSLLLTLQEITYEAADFPGNFIAISPENKLTVIPWGSENLQRVLEYIREAATDKFGLISEVENKQIKLLESQCADYLRRIYKLEEKLEQIREDASW